MAVDRRGRSRETGKRERKAGIALQNIQEIRRRQPCGSIEPRSISGTRQRARRDETAANLCMACNILPCEIRTRHDKSHAIPFHHVHAAARGSITYNETRASDLFGGKPQIFCARPTSLRKRMRVERRRASLRSKPDVAEFARVSTEISAELFRGGGITSS